MTLVILAAGMGSRYGGLKQIDPLGPNGEFIIDYSIYDAKRAGFDRIAFIIKEENLEEFKLTVGNRIEKQLEVTYVFQDASHLPSPVDVCDRVKPWGTAHALWCCKDQINDKFAVINADDFYGSDSYRLAAEYLRSIPDDTCHYAMIGFMLKNTLSESGTVARGLCKVNKDGVLTKIDERLKIMRQEDGVIRFLEDDVWHDAGEETVASMNFWAFTPAVFEGIESGWDAFIARNKDNMQKAEYLLPTRIGEMINEKKAVVRVVPSPDSWHGVTYRNDREPMVAYLKNLTDNGEYPEKLWS